MDSTIVVEVTSEDIANGEPCEPGKCAVALSLNRAFPSYRATVLGDTAVLKARGIGHDEWYSLGTDGSAFVDRFDDASGDERNSLSPQSFEIHRIKPPR